MMVRQLRIIKIVSIVVLMVQHSIGCRFFFDTIVDVQQYAVTHLENPIIANGSILDSDHEVWYRQQRITLFERIQHFFGIPIADISLYNNIFEQLQVVVHDRELHVLSGDYGMVINDKQPQYIIFGEVQGAFHSLVRCLTHLYDEHKIDKNFRIIEPHTYIIFNGNTLSLMYNQLIVTYGIETLAVVLTLMCRNPEHVIYVRGYKENSFLYDSSSLFETINIILSNRQSFLTTLKTMLKRFFMALPQAVYSLAPFDHQKPLEALCIAGEKNIPVLAVDELRKQCKKGMQIPRYRYVHFVPTAQNIKKTNRLVKVHIGSIDRLSEYFESHGLDFVYYYKDLALWSVFSAPIPFYQELIGFDRDAFVIAEQKNPIARTQLHLYTRPLARQGLLFDHEVFDGELGVAINNANKQMLNSAESIELASPIYLTKAAGNIGKHLRTGLKLAEWEINTAGGINHQPLKIHIIDNEDQPGRARHLVEELYNENHITMLIEAAGIPSIQAYKYLLDAGKMFLFFPRSAANFFFQESEKSMIHIDPSYSQEVIALVHYAINKVYAQKMVFFYRDDQFGNDIMSDVRHALRFYGIKDWIELPYARNEVTFDQQVAKLQTSLFDSIFFISYPGEVGSFIRQAGVKTFSNISVFCLSVAINPELDQSLKSKGINVIFSQIVPEVSTSSMVPVVQEFYQVCRQFHREPSTLSFRSFLGVKILCDAMEHIDQPITRQKLMEKLMSYHHYNYKGIDLDFNPKTRSLSEDLWLRLEDGTTIRYEAPKVQ
jgi:ABC-type branched-subunit amino acid transport system substrate-binding protein